MVSSSAKVTYASGRRPPPSGVDSSRAGGCPTPGRDPGGSGKPTQTVGFCPAGLPVPAVVALD